MTYKYIFSLNSGTVSNLWRIGEFCVYYIKDIAFHILFRDMIILFTDIINTSQYSPCIIDNQKECLNINCQEKLSASLSLYFEL